MATLLIKCYRERNPLSSRIDRFGGNGFTREYPVEKFWRDAGSDNGNHEGTSNIAASNDPNLSLERHRQVSINARRDRRNQKTSQTEQRVENSKLRLWLETNKCNTAFWPPPTSVTDGWGWAIRKGRDELEF